jgi:hypothetical protein
MRLPEALPQEEKELVDRFLELDLQAAPPSPFPETQFGHLAGFSSPRAQRAWGLAEPPYPELVSTSGRIFSRAEVLVTAARDEIAQGRLRARAEHEVAQAEKQSALFGAFEEAYRDDSFGASLPTLGSRREVEEAVLRLSLTREGLAAAEERFSAVARPEGGGIAREEQERLANSFLYASRQAREAERLLEDLLDAYPLPPGLDLADLGRYAELRLATQEALDRTTPFGDSWESDPTRTALANDARLLALSAELAEFEESRGLPRSYEEGPHGLPIPRSDVRLVGQAELALPGVSHEEELPFIRAYADAKAAYDGTLDRASSTEEVIALRNVTAAEIRLEAAEHDLRRNLQVFTRAQRHLSETMAPLEEAAETHPVEHMPKLEQHVHQLCAVEEAIGVLEPRLARLEAGRLDRDLTRLGPLLLRDPTAENVARYSELYERRLTHEAPPLQSSPGELLRTAGLETTRRQLAEADRHLKAATRIFVTHPSQRSLELFQKALAGHAALRLELDDSHLAHDYRTAQREIRATLREISQYTRQLLRVPPQVLDRFRDALGLHNAAESARARRISPALPRPGSPDLLRTLRRLRQGDLTPETLSRLNRQLSNQLHSATGRAPLPEPRQPAKTDLLQAITANRRDRHALVRSARAASSHGTIHPPTLEHLQKALGRYQASSSELNRLASQYARGPQRRILPVAYFLDHPRFRRAPHRAVVAWTAHAVRQGLPARQAVEMLARPSRTRLATPFVASRRLGGLASVIVGRWLARLPERAMLEYVHHDR